jgi:hypothetical protein
MALSGLPAFISGLNALYNDLVANPPADEAAALLRQAQFVTDFCTLIDTFVRTAVVKVDTGISVHLGDTVVPGLSVPGLAVNVPAVPYTGATAGGTTGEGVVGGSAETDAVGNGHLE